MDAERDALVALYRATNGYSWTYNQGWCTDAPLSEWYGVKVSDGRVVELNLFSNYLRGSIPKELGQLGALTELNLCVNQLEGSIPKELGQLGALTRLILGINQLKGSIPKELGQLGALTELYLGDNQLEGSIPKELRQLGALTELSLGRNRLEGSIPKELGQLGALTRLDIRFNKLEGSIPKEMGQLGALTVLNINNNKLEGSIPKELGQLGALTELKLSSNQLKGSIPKELGQLGALTVLVLDGNKLEGAIPAEFHQLTALEHLDLFSNQLTGAIPAEFRQLTDLGWLDLSYNQLTGAIPAELCQLTDLDRLYLSSNQLIGAIPAELCQLTDLGRLDLSSNQLTGAIPAELCQLTDLGRLDLSSNQLTDLGNAEHALQLVDKFNSANKYHSNEGSNKPLMLQDNPWRMPPEAVVERGLEAIKTFLGDVLKADEVKSLNLLKVVLVGSESVGKTSLVQTISAGSGSRTDEDTDISSTVGIELRRRELNGTTVEFYDCAGQVDYYGMHQTFLTRRALFLLVWDVTKFNGLTGNDLTKAVDKSITTWLHTLHLRAPGATVLLVANKCDEGLRLYEETARRVEKVARKSMKEWQPEAARNSMYRQHDVNGVKLLEGVSCVSCLDYGGIETLVKRVLEQGSTSIQVPPAWELALQVIDALRDGHEPLQVARKHLKLVDAGTNRIPVNMVNDDNIVTKSRLVKLWENVVSHVSPALQELGRMAVVSNWETALEGALWISEFAGQILLIDGGELIFLDVTWLSKVLSPIMNHKLEREDFHSPKLNILRDELVHEGILTREFALHLWRPVLRHFVEGKKDKVANALFRTLLSLGVVIPLDTMGATFFRTLLHLGGYSSFNDRLLVIMRLPDDCSTKINDKLTDTNALEGCEEVTLKWRFSMGPPYGLVERLIASCYVIGMVERETCSRFVIRYDINVGNHNHSDKVLTMRMIGPLTRERVWVALRYVASAMVTLSRDWPGAQWQGWPECLEHPSNRMYLAPPHQVGIGDMLLPEDSLRAACDCKHQRDGVLAQIHKRRLGAMIDPTKDNPFEGIDQERAGFILVLNGWCQAWGVSQDEAWRVAKALGVLALSVILPVVVTGILDEEDVLWIAFLSVMVLFLVVALLAAVLLCRSRYITASP